MKLNPGRMPPSDGIDKFHLPVGNGVVIHGGTREALVKNVFEYRIRNNLDVSNIEADIDLYYCSKWPGFCHGDKTGNYMSSRAVEQMMLNRVSQWVSRLAQRMPRGGYPLTDENTAEARAAICAQCPKNGHWRTGCGGCSAGTLSLIQQLKQLKKTPKDGNLKACEIGGWENSAAIWLPADCTPISDEQRGQMPANCWRKAMP